MQTNKTIRILLIAAALLAGAVCGYAQKKDSPPAEENMLRYRYVDRASRTVRFDTTRTFAERTYFFAGAGIEGLFQVGNHPESAGYALGNSFGGGWWATPIHGVEMSVG